MSTHARGIRSACLALLIACCIALGGVGQGEAREYEIDRTADCGLRSERRCSIDAMLAVWTDDVDGVRRRVEVDVSWVGRSSLDDGRWPSTSILTGPTASSGGRDSTSPGSA